MPMYQIVDSASVATGSTGLVLPWILGLKYGVPAIPLRVPAQAILREDVTSGSTVFKLSDPKLLAKFPASGDGEIDQERFSYTSHDPVLVALNVSARGIDATAAAAHTAGTKVFEQLDEHVYAFFCNPTGYTHSAIGNIYLNQILKDPTVQPTHVVTLGDTAAATSLLTGQPLSVGTVRFDMSTVIPPTSVFSSTNLSSSAAAVSTALTVATQSTMPTLQTFGSSNTAPGNLFKPIASSPLAIAPPAATQTAPAAPAVPTAFSTIPQLGTVTGDVTGMLDDASGTYTGTPGALIENPVKMAQFILERAFDQTNINFASFQE